MTDEKCNVAYRVDRGAWTPGVMLDPFAIECNDIVTLPEWGRSVEFLVSQKDTNTTTSLVYLTLTHLRNIPAEARKQLRERAMTSLEHTRELTAKLQLYYSKGVDACSQYDFPLQYLQCFYVLGGLLYAMVDGQLCSVGRYGKRSLGGRSRWNAHQEYLPRFGEFPSNNVRSGAFLVMPASQEAKSIGLPQRWTRLYPRAKSEPTIDEMRERVINPKPKSKGSGIDRSAVLKPGRFRAIAGQSLQTGQMLVVGEDGTVRPVTTGL